MADVWFTSGFRLGQFGKGPRFERDRAAFLSLPEPPVN
jgi:hypothetical protein